MRRGCSSSRRFQRRHRDRTESSPGLYGSSCSDLYFSVSTAPVADNFGTRSH
jgi:hypothetical protein